MNVGKRAEACEIDALDLLAVGVEDDEIGIMVVDIIDRELRVAVSLPSVTHKRGDLRIMIQLSSRAGADLDALQPRALVVANHGLVENITLQFHVGVRAQCQAQHGGHGRATHGGEAAGRRWRACVAGTPPTHVSSSWTDELHTFR